MNKLFLMIFLCSVQFFIESSQKKIEDIDWAVLNYVEKDLLPLKDLTYEAVKTYQALSENNRDAFKNDFREVNLTWIKSFANICKNVRKNPDVLFVLHEIKNELNAKANGTGILLNLIPENINEMSTYIDNNNDNENKFQLITDIFFKFSMYSVIPNKNITFGDYKDIFNKYLTVFEVNPVDDNDFENKSFEEEAVEPESQTKKNYIWIKFFVVLGFGGLAYWLYNRSKK